MKQIVLNSFLILTLLSFTKTEKTSVRELLQTTSVSFETSLEAAKTKAKATNKNIFVFAFAAWSGPCKRMVATTFASEKVATQLNTNFVNLSLECENEEGNLSAEGKAFVEMYGIKNYPVVLIIEPTGKMVKSSLSVKDEAQLLEFVK